MKNVFLILVIIPLTQVLVYAQRIQTEKVDWEQVFKRDTINSKKQAKVIARETPAYFLLKFAKESQQNILDLSDIQLARQLNDTTFIVEAFESTLRKNENKIRTFIPVNNKWKLSPLILKNYATASKQVKVFNIVLFRKSDLDSLISCFPAELKVNSRNTWLGIVQVQCTEDFLLNNLINLDAVSYVENATRPIRSESPIPGFDNAVNTINVVHAKYPSLNGRGLVVSVKEDQYNIDDLDLLGRNIPTTISSAIQSQHATDMATLIGGAGSSFNSGLGAVNMVSLSSADSKNLMPDLEAYETYHISVQNHSYGVGIENFYGADAAAYDQSIISQPGLLHVFSAGNSGDQTSTDGLYSGLPGVSNLTGSFKMAKNIITVGSIDVLGAAAALSSKGPAYDGRVKPDLMAYGQSGSSEAAAITSGIILLVQNAYTLMHNGELPENALVKAILINSAKDIGVKGIDFLTGYGSVDAYRAVENMLNGNYFAGNVSQGQEKSFTLFIPDQAKNLKVTLVWNDPPANPNAFKSLVNDLDITFVNQTTGETWQPWVLNSASSLDSLTLLPHRGRDSINVVEQVSLDLPIAGDYTVRVSGAKVKDANQPFFVSYQWDTIGQFHWTYPSSQDFMGRQGSNTFRWESAFPENQKGKLEYSLDGGQSWKLIDPNVNVSQQYYPWTPVDTFSVGLARMTINGNSFITDTFTFSSPIRLQVGFDCMDSLMLYWDKIKSANHYHVYSISGNRLTPVSTTSDSSAILIKGSGNAYFAVAPVLSDNIEGVKSYTINADDQGIGCFVSSFRGVLESEKYVALDLELSSTNQITQVQFEKLISGTWTIIDQILSVNSQSLSGKDRSPVVGSNIYRARIGFSNGKFITSEQITFYYFGDSEIIIAPNPVIANHTFRILSNYLFGFSICIEDITGRVLYQNKSPNSIEYISSANMKPGIYIITLRENSGKAHSYKLIVD